MEKEDGKIGEFSHSEQASADVEKRAQLLSELIRKYALQPRDWRHWTHLQTDKLLIRIPVIGSVAHRFSGITSQVNSLHPNVCVLIG